MLKDKIILITGASRGIGRSVAYKLASVGATCILLARTKNALESLYDEIIAEGFAQPNICLFNLCNATLEDYDDLRQNIANRYGRLDGLIHNAATLGTLTPLECYNPQTWYKVLQVNLNSTFILTQACLPLLKKSTNGSIIFTIPELAHKPKANWGAYGVASAALLNMMQMLALELENLSNICVNAIQPVMISTSLAKEAYPALSADKFTDPAEITNLYVNLMNIKDRKINGQIFNTAYNVDTSTLDLQPINVAN